MKFNLGCPYYCEGYTCVDLHPHDTRVIKADVFDFLINESARYPVIDEIRTKNLLEHLADFGRFTNLCYRAMRSGGRLVIITDNAEFIPYYLPFWVQHTGIGAHAKDEYAASTEHNGSHHYAVFTKMHLRNLLHASGFRNISVRRITFGARLEATGVK